ncbi:MAG: hypothetical protein WB662_18670, partial [Methyloceanibacter sp.]
LIAEGLYVRLRLRPERNRQRLIWKNAMRGEISREEYLQKKRDFADQRLHGGHTVIGISAWVSC